MNHSPSGRVGRSRPERVFAAGGIVRLYNRKDPPRPLPRPTLPQGGRAAFKF